METIEELIKSGKLYLMALQDVKNKDSEVIARKDSLYMVKEISKYVLWYFGDNGQLHSFKKERILDGTSKYFKLCTKTSD